MSSQRPARLAGPLGAPVHGLDSQPGMLRKLFYFSVGAALFAPFSFVVADTAIYYVQFLVIFSLLLYVVLRNSGIRWGTRLDKTVAIYLGWIIFSFCANSLFTFDPGIHWRRLLSLLTTLSIGSTYLIGKELVRDAAKDFRHIVRGVVFAGAALSLFYLLVMYRSGLTNLWTARMVIGQRVPLVLSFIATIAGVLAIYRRKVSLPLLAMVLLSGLVVLLSLTRASYLQLVVGVLFILYFAGRKHPKRALVLVVITVIAVFLVVLYLPEHANTSLLISRFRLLLDVRTEFGSDYSGTFRLNMWKELASRLSDVPARWITGYGQLGASFVAGRVSYESAGGGLAVTASAHSEYFDSLIRNGLVGLVLFLVLLYRMIAFGMVRLKAVAEEARPLLLAHSVALIGVFFYGLFHETLRYQQFAFYFWFYAGILSNFMQAGRAGDSPKEEVRTSPGLI